jgi:hypothetical protein
MNTGTHSRIMNKVNIACHLFSISFRLYYERTRSSAGAVFAIRWKRWLDEAATRREKHLKSVYNSSGVQFRAP